MAIVTKYHISVRILHAIVGIAVIGALCMGYYMTGMENSPEKIKYYMLHKSFGVLILLLLFLRVFSRSITKAPKSFYKFASFNGFTERVVYFVFYISMFLMPVSGYLMSNAFGYPVSFFGFEMPMITAKNEHFADFCHSLHIFNSYLLVTIVLLHISSVGYRVAVKKHNILNRMV